jgi:hypothetical protein
VQTKPVAAGTYLVTGMEAAQINGGPSNGIPLDCVIGTASTGPSNHAHGVSGPFSQTANTSVTVTDSLTVSAGDSFMLFCIGNGQSLNSSISAIQLNTVSANTSGKK